MQNAIATVILLAATIILISLTVFADDGTFGDAKTQKERSHAITNSVTIPTQLPKEGGLPACLYEHAGIFMKTVIAFVILSPFFLYCIFQPVIERTVQYKDQVLQKKHSKLLT